MNWLLHQWQSRGAGMPTKRKVGTLVFMMSLRVSTARSSFAFANVMSKVIIIVCCVLRDDLCTVSCLYRSQFPFVDGVRVGLAEICQGTS